MRVCMCGYPYSGFGTGLCGRSHTLHAFAHGVLGGPGGHASMDHRAQILFDRQSGRAVAHPRSEISGKYDQKVKIVKNCPYTSIMMYHGAQGVPGCQRDAGFRVRPILP